MRSLSFLVCTILFGSLSVALAQSDRGHSDKLYFPPRLEIKPCITNYYSSLRQGDSADRRTFVEIQIRERQVEEFYPLLTTIFFDRGSVNPSQRYKLFGDSRERERFSDTTIPGGTLQKYLQTLNIVGYRMERSSGTTIRIAGGYSKEPAESREIAGKRALRVRNYLTDIWGIDPARITIDSIDEPHGDLSDTLLQEELRHVRIASNDWELIQPICVKEVRRYTSPESFALTVDPMIDPTNIISCAVEAHWGNRLHRSFELPWHTDSSELSIRWDWLADDEDIPIGEEFAYVQAMLLLRNGERRSSNTVIIPVRTILTADGGCRRSGMICKRYHLFLFPRGESSWSSAHQQILTTYLAPRTPAAFRIFMWGHTDIGEQDRTRTLSHSRAKVVAERLSQSIDTSGIQRIDYLGARSYEAPFANELPEGRCYNRTVGITIEHLANEGGWHE